MKWDLKNFPETPDAHDECIAWKKGFEACLRDEIALLKSMEPEALYFYIHENILEKEIFG